MSIIFAGDTHGRLDAFKSIDADAREAGHDIVIQVGDFGVHFLDNCSVAEWFGIARADPPGLLAEETTITGLSGAPCPRFDCSAGRFGSWRLVVSLPTGVRF